MDGENLTRWIDDTVGFWQIISYVIALFLSLSWIASRFESSFKKSIDTESMAHLLNIASGGFFILIIFITLNVWTDIQTTERQAIVEAAALTNMLKYETHFKKEIAEKLLKATEDYIISVRTDEWKEMSRGHSSHITFQKWHYLNTLIVNLDPKDPDNGIFLTQLLANLDTASIARHQRMGAISSVVPAGLRRAVFFGCLFIVTLLGALCQKRKILPVIIFDIILAFNLSLTFLLDYPFSGGDTSVHNDMFYEGILQFIPDKPV